jgi:hypothetical protein
MCPSLLWAIFIPLVASSTSCPDSLIAFDKRREKKEFRKPKHNPMPALCWTVSYGPASKSLEVKGLLSTFQK